MLPADDIPAKPAVKNESQGNGTRKGTSTRPALEQTLKCPRCDSANTKFCYYNNYSLTQPRHFCKTCRRYWTRGGALRNVPIGGGCRKNKKTKLSSRLSGNDSKDSAASCSEIAGLKFFQGLSSSSPALEFPIGGLSFPRLQNNSSVPSGVLSPLSPATGSAFDFVPSGSSNSLMGLNATGFGSSIQYMSSLSLHSSLASSIESLSCLNQDLHWKLQQQRLATLFGTAGNINRKERETGDSSLPLDCQTQKLQPILFQNLEASKKDGGVGDNDRNEGTSRDTVTEWFFGNSFAAPAATPSSQAHGNDNASGSWNGVQAWDDLQHYSALP